MFTPIPRKTANAMPTPPKARRSTGRTMFAMAGTLSMALVAVLSPPVSANDDHDHDHHHHHHDDHHGRCSPHVFYKVHRLSPRNFFVPRTRFIDGPGGEMTVSVTREHEVLAFLETERERQRTWTDTHEVVHNLRKMGLPHLEERHKVFTGHDYTQKISKGMYGNMWYRVLGYRVGWSAWRVLGTCRHVAVDRGIANVPSRVEGWRYWETKHPKFKGRLISLK